MILLVDFGSQTAHLIGRRLRDLGAQVVTVTPREAYQKTKTLKPSGIVFSGGPASVYAKAAPTIDRRIFDLNIPILAICYGMQLTAHLLGGKVKPGKVKEFGPTYLKFSSASSLFASLPPLTNLRYSVNLSTHKTRRSFKVWMSHGDEVIKPPPGFKTIAVTPTVACAAMANEKARIYGVQFHPEVEHTEHGNVILKNFLKICDISLKPQAVKVETIIENIRQTIGNQRAIAAVSGGLDSTVAATLVVRAIGKNLIPIHIDSGLMRDGGKKAVVSYFTKLGSRPLVLQKEPAFLAALKGIADPERKRQIIGKLYIDFFEEILKRFPDVKFLVQGTIYSDVIESKGTRHADTIKSHHNVGGLPKTMKLQLIEPLRNLYTDQVRELAKKLNIPQSFISQQPHPGPGYAIRIAGEVTKERLDRVRQADVIVVEEMKKAGWYEKLLHSFAVATGINSTAVRGDGRGYGEVIAVRAVVSKDRMTADWAQLPFLLLQKISSRIVNEVPGVSRVVYDITTKPPATMEWE